MQQPHKIVKHTQTILRLFRTNRMSVFDHFVGLALKGLKIICKVSDKYISIKQLGVPLIIILEFALCLSIIITI